MNVKKIIEDSLRHHLTAHGFHRTKILQTMVREVGHGLEGTAIIVACREAQWWLMEARCWKQEPDAMQLDIRVQTAIERPEVDEIMGDFDPDPEPTLLSQTTASVPPQSRAPLASDLTGSRSLFERGLCLAMKVYAACGDQKLSVGLEDDGFMEAS